MTVSGSSPHTRPPAADGTSPRTVEVGRPSVVATLDQVCPYLLAPSGVWRAAHPSRDQACWAVDPPTILVPAKQRDLCLVAAHRSCTAYAAARAAGTTRPSPGDDGAALWPVIRSTPVVLDPEGRLPHLPSSRTRAGGQLALVALMVVAFAVLIVARTSQSGTAPGAGSPTGSLAAAVPSLEPTPAPTPSPSPSASPSPTPSASASPLPSATRTPPPSPSGTGRYRVKAGDTLSSIAARFGTTVKVLKTLNGITNAALIHPGQSLIVPGA